jgi:hypothetical protein
LVSEVLDQNKKEFKLINLKAFIFVSSATPNVWVSVQFRVLPNGLQDISLVPVQDCVTVSIRVKLHYQ